MTEPEDPLGGMMASAISQHEMYENWVAVGFTPGQALELLMVVVAEIIRGAID